MREPIDLRGPSYESDPRSKRAPKWDKGDPFDKGAKHVDRAIAMRRHRTKRAMVHASTMERQRVRGGYRTSEPDRAVEPKRSRGGYRADSGEGAVPVMRVTDAGGRPTMRASPVPRTAPRQTSEARNVRAPWPIIESESNEGANPRKRSDGDREHPTMRASHALKENRWS
jgi:hypothetical protein